MVAIQGDEYETKDMEDILKQADEALYSAKTQGKKLCSGFWGKVKGKLIEILLRLKYFNVNKDKST